jgi:hypothetical protein
MKALKLALALLGVLVFTTGHHLLGKLQQRAATEHTLSIILRLEDVPLRPHPPERRYAAPAQPA